MDISFVTPSIRTGNWHNLYRSIQESFHGSWEIIFVGPYDNPTELEFADNVRCIKDFGSPTRCRHIGMLNAKGKWMCYSADDLSFFPNAVNNIFEQTKNKSCRRVFLGKYAEGKVDNPEMCKDEYYTIGYHDMFKGVLAFLPYNYWLIQAGLISIELLKEIGGWDCRFEVCAMACSDLSMRLQNYGINIEVCNKPLFFASHLPCLEGDHAPIHYAQLLHDIPLFNEIYTNTNCVNRTTIDINNWMQSPDIWSRRFQT